MQTGIFSKTFLRTSLEQVLKAIAERHFTTVHFNMKSAGMNSIPSNIPADKTQEIGEAFEVHNLKMAGISATYNIIHPKLSIRQNGLAGFSNIAKSCRTMGTNFISICSGTYNPNNMWVAHKRNNSNEAWSEMLHELEMMIMIAEAQHVYIGIEPEHANVINSASKARKAIAELQSDRIKIIFDAANLYIRDHSIYEIDRIISDAFDLLGDHIAMIHIKDRNQSGDVVAPGKGIIPFDNLFQKLKDFHFDGPIITHGLHEKDALSAYLFINQLISSS